MKSNLAQDTRSRSLEIHIEVLRHMQELPGHLRSGLHVLYNVSCELVRLL